MVWNSQAEVGGVTSESESYWSGVKINYYNLNIAYYGNNL